MSEIRLIHSNQKVLGLDIESSPNLNGNGQTTLGLEIAPKVHITIYYVELGKPDMFLTKVINP